MEQKAVELILYRWAGSWGPFKVKIPCGECALTVDVIKDTLETELKGIPVNFIIREWLSEWWKPLMKGGWHAPIVIVGDKIVSQGHALNRGILTEAVIEEHVKLTEIKGNHLFGKETCPHCVRAKGYLKDANIEFNYHDVVKNPRALYEMISRVKPIVGPKTPITVPQIWLNGSYIGGADQLGKLLNHDVEVNPERGQNSLTAEPAIMST